MFGFGWKSKEIKRLKRVIKNQNEDYAAIQKERNALRDCVEAYEKEFVETKDTIEELTERLKKEEELRAYIDKQTRSHYRIINKAIEYGRPLTSEEEEMEKCPPAWPIFAVSGMVMDEFTQRENFALSNDNALARQQRMPGKSAAHSKARPFPGFSSDYEGQNNR